MFEHEREGRATKVPWPAPYWQKNEDGINKRWGKEIQSPVEKYARAFRLNPIRLAQSVSDVSGIDGETDEDSIVCKVKEECPEKDSTCAIRRGRDQGICMPDWWGMLM